MTRFDGDRERIPATQAHALAEAVLAMSEGGTQETGMGAPAARISGLHKTFGDVRAVDGIDLEVAAGEFVTLLGPSGCGKTTTLRIVAGLERATAGRVELFDKVVVDTAAGIETPPNKRPIGMVFQSYALWPHMTALANVAFPLQNKELGLPVGRSRGSGRLRPSSEIYVRAMEALERVQCEHLSKRYPGEMSGGQQQRVALARSIVHSPPLVLLDEPLSNLDAKLRRDLRVELRRLQEDIGFAAIYVTHDQAEALAMSDRVVLMRDGMIEQVATPRRLFELPGTPYAAGFIGDHNLLSGEILSEPTEGTAIVATPIGPIKARPARDGVVARVGARGVVALRTDRIRIEDAGTPDPSTGDPLPLALVLGSAYNGAYVDILFEVEGQHLSVRDYSGGDPPARGAKVSLLVSTEAVLADVTPEAPS